MHLLTLILNNFAGTLGDEMTSFGNISALSGGGQSTASGGKKRKFKGKGASKQGGGKKRR